MYVTNATDANDSPISLMMCTVKENHIEMLNSMLKGV